jgi:hypothetical protein
MEDVVKELNLTKRTDGDDPDRISSLLWQNVFDRFEDWAQDFDIRA